MGGARERENPRETLYPPDVRKPSFLIGVFALVVVTSSGFVGCTSLLGDYDVTTNGPIANEGGPDAPVCTACGANACVDLATDSANCGACGTACAGGQTCQTSACKCPADRAFCGSQCVAATRMACGASCVACQPDEVCSMGCTAAPLPAFESVPRETTGWTDTAGVPIAFKLKSTDVPGTIYECRTGPDATFTPTDPPWKPCDDATGANPTHKPTELAAKRQGTYRTEHRYRSDTYRSPSIAFTYYVHHSLDKAAVCPRPGIATDGPKFTDAEYFQAAQAHNTMRPGTFLAVDPFPQPGNSASDPFVIRNPFIRIPFQGVRVPGGYNSWLPQPVAGQNFSVPFDHVVNERSLRHKFVLNATRTMLLVKRQYAHATRKDDCRNTFEFGSLMGRSRGPDGRGRKKLDCEALVLTVHGLALCMGRNAAGTAPAAQVLDKRPYNPANANFGNDGTGTVTGTANTTTLTASAGAAPLGALPNRWIYAGPKFGGRWYKVNTVVGLTITLATPLLQAVTAQPWKYSDFVNQLDDVFVAPAGFAHLYDDGKNWATARASPNFNPSFSTKCETPGCATGKPWLTFLPP